MDQSLQELVQVIATMPPEQVKVFLVEILALLPEPDQDDFYNSLQSVMGKSPTADVEDMASPQVVDESMFDIGDEVF